MTHAEKFAQAYPRSTDFLELEYLLAKDEIDTAAAAAGYRFAGFRLGRAIFTTKPPKPTRAGLARPAP